MSGPHRSAVERAAALPLSAYHLDAETHAALMAESQRRREALALKRAERVDLPLERRHGERRVTDRRASIDAHMAPTLHDADARHSDRRFTGAAMTGFGEWS